MARPKLNALPQDSVLQAHLRRQAGWPEDAPRLTRRDTGKRQRRELLDAIDRIGRANHLASQADAGRAQGRPDTAAMTDTGSTETIPAETDPAETGPKNGKQRSRPDERSGARRRPFGLRTRARGPERRP